MKLFFTILILLSISFLAVSADTKILTEEKLVSIVEKQDMKFENLKNTTELILKYEVEKTNQDINAVKDRVNDIGYAIDRFALLITFIGVLITTIVFFFSFKSNSEARQTVEDWLEENGDDYINKELQPITENFNKMISSMKVEMEELKKRSDLEIESLKGQLEEKGNEVIESLSSKIIEDNTSDIELSIKDKEYFEYQIKMVKSKSLINRTLQDYKKMILYYIVNRDYQKSIDLINKLLNNNSYSSVEKGMLHYFRGLNSYKQGLNDEAVDYLDKAIELAPKFVNAYTLKSKIYGFLRKNHREQKQLAKKALELDPNNYDAYINLAFAPIEEGYLNNNCELYAEAREYAKKAIEINPDMQIGYAVIGFTYLLENKYVKAKKWYLLAFDRNTKEWGYYDLFRVYLFLEEPFPKKLEEQYFMEYSNNNENFSLYLILKVLQNIKNDKSNKRVEIKEKVDEVYKTSKRQEYYFLELEVLKIWIKQESNREKRENLEYAIELFDEYRVK